MNKDKRNNIKLLGTLNNADESGIIANASQIYDANEDKSTQDVSKEHKERIETLETKESSMQTTLENITKTGEASAASNVTYNHSDSKLDATNVQQAIDKILDLKANADDIGEVRAYIVNEVRATIDDIYKKSNYNDGDNIIDFNTIHLITDNPEFVCVAVDVNEKILYGIKTDGQLYFGVGCPQQVKDYIDNVIANINANIAEVRKRSNYNDGDNIIDFNTIHTITDNPEFAIAAFDANDRILYGIKADGQPYWGVGVPKVVRDYVDKQVNDILGTDDIKTKIGSSRVVDRNLDALKAIYAAKKHYDDSSQNGWYLTSSNSNLFCIAHGTDFHSDNIRMKNFMDFVDNVDEINLAVGTGDFVVSPTDDEFNIVCDINPKKKDFLKVLGNHDVYSDKFTSADVASKLNMDSPYYYKDYKDYNVRIIVLNQYDVPSNITVSSGNLRDLRNHTEHFSQTQIDWFISVLDSAIESNLNVIICMHSPEFEQAPVKNDKKFYQRNWNWVSKLSYIDGAIIEDIVNAFKKGIAINKTYTYQNENADIPSVTANHTFGGNGKFICYLAGHLHSDFIGVSNNYEDQLYLIETCTCAVPQIKNTRNYGEEVNDLPRIVGTSCEDAFNVYCFDFDKKQIKVVRVGSNINDQMEFRDKEIYTYK